MGRNLQQVTETHPDNNVDNNYNNYNYNNYYHHYFDVEYIYGFV